MNAMFLKELADKTRRGLRGRIELGKAGGGVSFGYRIVRQFENGVVSTGEREIVPEEADDHSTHLQGLRRGRVAEADREGL